MEGAEAMELLDIRKAERNSTIRRQAETNSTIQAVMPMPTPQDITQAHTTQRNHFTTLLDAALLMERTTMTTIRTTT